MIAERQFRDVVDLAHGHISLELPIPGFSVERREPVAKRSQFLGREIFNLSLDLFDSAHSDFSYYIGLRQVRIAAAAAIQYVVAEQGDAMRVF